MLTQTSAGWTFTQGRETFGPYPTRDAAAEALYDVQRGRCPEQIIIDAIDAALADPHSIPETVAALTYRPFALCCTRIEALGLPEKQLDVVLSAVAELTDHLTSAATVAKLARAWAARQP